MMKIAIQNSGTTIIEVENPTFRKTNAYFFKIYEKDGVPTYDYLYKGPDGYFSYQHNFGRVNEAVITAEIATIEEYAAALSDFLKSVEKDQQDLYYAGEINITPNSQLNR